MEDYKLATKFLQSAPPLTILGNDTENTLSPIYITIEQLKTLLGIESGGGMGIYRQENFTSSGVWTKPVNMIGDYVRIILVGAGGGGTGKDNGGGGGGGGQIVIEYVNISLITEIDILIGVGGLTTGSGYGTDGSDSIISSLDPNVTYITAKGGKAGHTQKGGDSGGGLAGGRDPEETEGNAYTATVSEFGSTGGGGGSGFEGANVLGGNGGACIGKPGKGKGIPPYYSGGGGASWGDGGDGGDSLTANSFAQNGTLGGGGGGSINVATYGGAGGDGFCRIIWYE